MFMKNPLFQKCALLALLAALLLIPLAMIERTIDERKEISCRIAICSDSEYGWQDVESKWWNGCNGDDQGFWCTSTRRTGELWLPMQLGNLVVGTLAGLVAAWVLGDVYVAIAVVLAMLILKEKVSAGQWLGILMIAAGVATLSLTS